MNQLDHRILYCHCAYAKVVPAEVTRRYQALIPGARYVELKRSGHIGLLTHPAQFADIVTGFINANGH